MGMLANPKHERFAFERALLVPRLQAARAAGYDEMTAGNAAKLERNPKIKARIDELRAVDEEMLQAKREKVDERLSAAAFGDIVDFLTIDPVTKKLIEVDWDGLKAAGLSVIISEFSFDKDTGILTKFKKDDPLNALSQLRDMHGFKAPTRTEHTGKDGGPMELTNPVTDQARARALQAFVAKTRQAKSEKVA